MPTGRDAQFTHFATARSSVLMGTAIRLCSGNFAAAEDLVQETLIRTYVSWGRVKDPQLRDAYVRRIMIRLAQRPRFTSETSVERVPDTTTLRHESPYSSIDDHLFLWPYLTALPPRQRAALVLRFYLDLTERDTADALGCSVGTVKTHVHRALRKLRVDIPVRVRDKRGDSRE